MVPEQMAKSLEERLLSMRLSDAEWKRARYEQELDFQIQLTQLYQRQSAIALWMVIFIVCFASLVMIVSAYVNRTSQPPPAINNALESKGNVR